MRAHPSGTALHGPCGRQPLSALLPHRLQVWSRTSAGAFHGLCLLQAAFTAVLWAPPWLHVEVCSVWWGRWRDRGTACSSMGLSCAVGAPLSELTMVPAGLFFLHSYFSLPAAVVQCLLPFLNLFSHRSWLSSGRLWVSSGAAEAGSELMWGSCWLALPTTKSFSA